MNCANEIDVNKIKNEETKPETSIVNEEVEKKDDEKSDDGSDEGDGSDSPPVPVKVIGATDIDPIKKLQYLIKFSDGTFQLLDRMDARALCPMLLVGFLEKKLVFRQHGDSADKISR